jgi:hypothetical protein
MRSGNRNYIDEQKRILSPLKFAQDYLCSWESVADQFYYSFDIHKHTVDDIADRRTDLYTFHDFNKRVMTAIVAQVIDDGLPTARLEVLKSYAIKDCSTEGIAEAIRQDFPKRRLYSIIDMSGTQVNRDTTSPFGITDRIILEKYGFQIVNGRKSNPLISDTDNTVNGFINADRLRIKKDDKLLIEALTTYHFEDGSRKRLVKYTEQKYAHIDGLGDCLRYGIHHLFPIQHEQTLKEYIGMDPRYARMNDPANKYKPESPLYPGGPSWEDIINGDEINEDYQTY